MASVAASSATNNDNSNTNARGPFLNRFTTTTARRRDGPHEVNKNKSTSGAFRWQRGRTASVETLQSQPSSDNLLAGASAVATASKQPLLLEKTTEPTPTTNETNTTTANATDNTNLMEWLETACPGDCLPQILAFCGPQQTAALSRTNRFWRAAIVDNEATWRVLCQELYKWKPGDREPSSWFDLYRNSPCVPTDYSSIPKALQMATSQRHRARRHLHRSSSSQLQIRSVRVLLRPGKYVLKQAIQIQAAPGVAVSLETVELPKNLYHRNNSNDNISDINGSETALAASRPIIMEQPLPLELPRTTTPTRNRKPSFRNLFRCHRRPDSDDPESSVTDDLTDWDHHDWWHGTDTTENSNSSNHTMKHHATLLLRSRRPNEPVFRVQQGLLRLRNVEIRHRAHGLDIWNGNAAVQIQPSASALEHPSAAPPRPTAVLEQCLVTSQSGRGIVNIDGGKVVVKKCAVADCAATGVYIGGPGSSLVLEESDVVRNGVGHHHFWNNNNNNNNAPRRGIARGHSGIYLEQGVARIRDCHVASNTLSGISVVSPDNAVLHLRQSTLVQNGTHQLELPPPGSASRRQSTTTNANNVFSDANNNNDGGDAEMRLRSGLLRSLSSASGASSSTPEQHRAAAIVPENHGPLPF